jgi:hypothetical protein
MSHISRFAAVTILAFTCSSNVVNIPVESAWDSNAKLNPTHPTYNYLTEWGTDQKDLTFSEPEKM